MLNIIDFDNLILKILKDNLCHRSTTIFIRLFILEIKEQN